MIRLLLVLLLVLSASTACAQPTRKGTLTARVAVLGTALESAGTTYTAALSDASLVQIDVVNSTDCNVEVRLDDATNAPAVIVEAGTFKEIDFGEFGFYSNTSVSVREITGVTCSSGSVYIQGMIADVAP